MKRKTHDGQFWRTACHSKHCLTQLQGLLIILAYEQQEQANNPAMWHIILTSIITSLVGSGLLTWYLQERVKHKYGEKLATHEANLKRDYDVQIERLKADLALRSIQFNRVFERTADTIIDCHKKLVELWKLQNNRMSATAELQEECRRLFRAKSTEFWEFFLPNKIFLPKKTVASITVFLTHLEFLPIASLSRNPDEEKNDFESKENQWKKYKEISQKIIKSLELLEDDFQRILGFEAEPKI